MAKDSLLVPVILCGGAGTRLWPLSRQLFPKQLLALGSERSLLQETAARLERLPTPVTPPLVVCNDAHRFLVDRQLRQLGLDPTLILEPAGRNTAPAIALAALVARERHGEDALLLVLAADHRIEDAQALARAVALARPAAAAGSLVTFGVPPTRPETGYGYIAPQAGHEPGVRPVAQFIEKPDQARAESLLAAGGYLWNSGMFLFRAGTVLAELTARAPAIVEACRQALAGGSAQGSFIAPERAAFLASPADSIDYAVMEKTDRAAVVRLDTGWSDIGSWAALHDVSAQDQHNNTLLGDALALDCRDSYIHASSRLVTAVGLEGCVVIETADAVLVAPRQQSQQVKRLVDELTARQRPEVQAGREVFRPWGSFDSLDNGQGYQVKRLTVLPGAVLSLQLHHRRAEHWVVVAGTARITRGEEVFDLPRGGHTHIPVETRHRIENPGSEPLHIIEIQIGDYLGEDDIVRFEDAYGRQGRTD
jgi:mannose-1-phosphate guanylyltransferase / mannose-6-phosphate isomerase